MKSEVSEPLLKTELRRVCTKIPYHIIDLRVIGHDGQVCNDVYLLLKNNGVFQVSLPPDYQLSRITLACAPIWNEARSESRLLWLQ